MRIRPHAEICPRTRIVVFAKAPVPGQVKTRLTPIVSERDAAELAKRMLATTLHTAVAAGIGTVELCASPALGSPDWAGVVIPERVVGSVQSGGDLGARIGAALRRRHSPRKPTLMSESLLLRESVLLPEPVLLIGTDCIELDSAHLRQAATFLTTHDAVIYPAADGGFVLLGLNRYRPELLRNISWSTPCVADQVTRRITALGWALATGDTLHDIDTADDLQRLPHEWLASIRRTSSLSNQTLTCTPARDGRQLNRNLQPDGPSRS